MTTRYHGPDAETQAVRMAEMWALYDSLPQQERERIDAECWRLEKQVPRIGPRIAFEIVMSVRLFALRMVTT